MKSIFFLSSLLLTLNAASAAEEKKPAKTVFVKEALLQDIFDSYVYPAKVMPKIHAYVLSETQGIVSAINVRLGQEVKEGQNLVGLKNSDPVYRFKPQSMKSPISGTVSGVYVNEGSSVPMGEKLISITDTKQYKILIEVTANDLTQITKDLKGTLSLTGVTPTFDVSVVGISPVVDPATGTALVELSLSDARTIIPLGALGQVTFKSNLHQGFVITEDAVIYQGKKPYLRLLKDGKSVKNVEVELGPKRRGEVEIIKGLNQKDVVIDRASGFLAENEEVQVQAEKEK